MFGNFTTCIGAHPDKRNDGRITIFLTTFGNSLTGTIEEYTRIIERQLRSSRSTPKSVMRIFERISIFFHLSVSKK